MTDRQKQTLLKDLCARLPYGVRVKCGREILTLNVNWLQMFQYHLDEIKPYLRPMSSMTDNERKEYESFIFTQYHEWDGHGTSTEYVEIDDVERYVTWLNKKGFDYRGLIPIGLALEAPEGMYKTE